MSEYIFVTNIFEYSNIFVTLCFRSQNQRRNRSKSFLPEMIFTALLLLQLALHYTVEGKHFLVKTKDKTKRDQTKGKTSLEQNKTSLEENKTNLEQNSPVRGQVTAFTLLSDQICSIKL